MTCPRCQGKGTVLGTAESRGWLRLTGWQPKSESNGDIVWCADYEKPAGEVIGLTVVALPEWIALIAAGKRPGPVMVCEPCELCRKAVKA
jgi:hypothetical protein